MGPQAAVGRMILLVVLMLSAETESGALTSPEDPEPSSVPVPRNVLIKSYNLNPVVCWKYQNMSQTPIFTVQVKMYPDNWTDACTNIADHCCNIYEHITYPDLPAWARVKAKVGQKESDYARSEEFIMCRKGKVGPPGLDIRRKEDRLVVHVFHPEVTVNGESQETMFGDGSTCYTFDYTVHVKHDRNGESLHTTHNVDIEDCNETLCELNISVSTLNSSYCVSVFGKSSFWQVNTETSKDVCIAFLHGDRKDSTWILVVALLVPFTIAILVFAYWYFKKNPFKRKSIMLPKSLLSVVRNATSETKPESKYSLVMSCQPAVLENETVICEEHLSTVTADNLGAKGHEELPKETEAVVSEGSASALMADSPPTPIQSSRFSLASSNQSGTCSLTTYHSRNGSDSGLVGTGSSVSDSEFLPNNNSETKMAGQDPPPARKAPTFSGYDKPHMLVDVLVDGGDGKESLIGYRLTGDVQDPEAT